MNLINGELFTFTAEKRMHNRLSDVKIQAFNRFNIIDNKSDFIITESTFRNDKNYKGDYRLYSTGVKFHFKIPNLPPRIKRSIIKVLQQSLPTTQYYLTNERNSRIFLKVYRVKLDEIKFKSLLENFPDGGVMVAHALLWCANNGEAFKDNVFQYDKFLKDFEVIKHNLHHLNELEEYFTNTLKHSFIYKLFLSKVKYSIFDYNLLKREFIFFAANSLKETNGEFRKNFKTVDEVYRYLFYKQYFLTSGEKDNSIRLISLLRKAVDDSHSVLNIEDLTNDLIEYNRVAPFQMSEYLNKINYTDSIEFKYFIRFISATIAHPLNYTKIFSNRYTLCNTPFYKAFIRASEQKTDYVLRELFKGNYLIMFVLKYGSEKVYEEWGSFFAKESIKSYNLYNSYSTVQNLYNHRIIFDLVEYYDIDKNVLKTVSDYYFNYGNWTDENKFLLLVNKGKYDFSMPFEWNMELC